MDLILLYSFEAMKVVVFLQYFHLFVLEVIEVVVVFVELKKLLVFFLVMVVELVF